MAFLTTLTQMNGGSTYGASRLDGVFEFLEDEDEGVQPCPISDPFGLELYALAQAGKVYVASTGSGRGVPFQCFGLFAYGSNEHCFTVNKDYSNMGKAMENSLWCNDVDATPFLDSVEDDICIKSLKNEAFKDVKPLPKDDACGRKMWELAKSGHLTVDLCNQVVGVVAYKDGYLLLEAS